ncbi:MAG: hypothetical protein B7Z73_19185 [Planctomycetia bacterium 21-64-5]|nr:MAG: hypothetical protein B7Z73_19185 [Planctomycetia bacterium 21-64-5]
MAKRNAILCQPVHLVELDLLIGGQRLPLAKPLPPARYYAFVSRADQRPMCQIVPWGVRQPLPTIAIPLLPGDPDVALELGAVFEETYERGGYDNDVDYTAPSPARLDDADSQWAAELARQGS